GRCRRAQCFADGDRERGALRAGAAASAARPDWARYARQYLHPAFWLRPFRSRARAPEDHLRAHQRLRHRAARPEDARAGRAARPAPERPADAALRRPRARRRPGRAGAADRGRMDRGRSEGRAGPCRALARIAKGIGVGLGYPVAPMDLALIAKRLDAYERLVRLDKPIGTLLLLWPTLWAVWLASGGRPRPEILMIF